LPCCTCDDFVQTKLGIDSVFNRWRNIGQTAQTIRDNYSAARTRWLNQKTCRESRNQKLALTSNCAGFIGVGYSFCSNADDCVGPLEVEFGFLVNAAASDPLIGGNIVQNGGFTQGLAEWTAAGAVSMTESINIGRDSWDIANSKLTNPGFNQTGSGSDPIVQVNTTQGGGAAQNEIQAVSFPVGTTEGTVQLTFYDQQTTELEITASVATVQAAMDALSNVESGDVIVSANSPNGWRFEFAGRYRRINVPLLAADSQIPGGGQVIVSPFREGQAPYSLFAIRCVRNNGETPRAVRINFSYGTAYAPIETTVLLPNGFTAADATAALEALPHIGHGNVFCRLFSAGAQTDPPIDFWILGVYLYNGPGSLGTLPGAGTTRITVTNTGSVGGEWAVLARGTFAQGQFSADYTSAGTLGPGVMGVRAAANERQFLYMLNSPSEGTFTLSFDGYTTAPLAYNATGTAVVAALAALPTIGPGNIRLYSGTQLPADPIAFEFQNMLGNRNLQMVTAAADLDSIAVTVTTVQEAAGGTHEIQVITIVGGTTAGGWYLVGNFGNGDETSPNMPTLVTTRVVREALLAMPTPAIGDINVAGSTGGPFTVTFMGQLAYSNIAQLQGITQPLTGWDRRLSALHYQAATDVNVGYYGTGSIWQSVPADVGETYRAQVDVDEVVGTVRLRVSAASGTELLTEVIPTSTQGGYESGDVGATDNRLQVMVETEPTGGITINSIDLQPWSGSLTQVVDGFVPGKEYRITVTVRSSDGTGLVELAWETGGTFAFQLDPATSFTNIVMTTGAESPKATLKISSPAGHLLQIQGVTIQEITQTSGVGNETRFTARFVPRSAAKNDMNSSRLLPYEPSGDFPNLKAHWVRLVPSRAARLSFVLFGCGAIDGDSLTISAKATLNGQTFAPIDETISLNMECVDTNELCE
jgi:hypothetical protein